MTERALTITQVSMFDRYGGAERVAWDLFQSYRQQGHDSYFAVGRKRSDDPNVIAIPNHETSRRWSRFWWKVHRDLQPHYGTFPGSKLLSRFVHRLAEPRGWLDTRRGLEDYHYPGTYQLLNLTPCRPDIMHCHNLHQKYFDLRAVPWLSKRVPLIVTMHDAWLLAGHCAHSFDCERWKTGCGHCPDLHIYPSIRRDASAENCRRKHEIYANSRLHIATPCQWLMDKVHHSMLMDGVLETRVIPYGVDLAIFRPANQAEARDHLGLPQDIRILLFAASGIRNNQWKDFSTLRTTIAQLGEGIRDRRILFLALGEDAPAERIGAAEIRFVPFKENPADVARYYQAADVYVHAARADTFPNTVLEALCCGTPVVATAVGGIPEQVNCFNNSNNATGILSACGDAGALATNVERLLRDEPLRQRLCENAANEGRRRFDLKRQVSDYLTWYRELLGSRQHQAAAPQTSRHEAAWSIC